MKITKELKQIIRSFCLGCCICIGFVLNGNLVKADLVNEYEDGILKYYTENSIEYKNIDLQAKKYILQKEEYQYGLERYQDNLSKFNGDSKGQIELNVQCEENQLQVNIYSFYEEYKDMWIDVNYRLLKYKFLKEFLQISVIEAKIDYQKAIIKEVNESLLIAQNTYKLGYISKFDVNLLRTQLEEEKANERAYEIELKQIKLQVGNETGLYDVVSVPLKIKSNIETKNQYTKKLLDNNLTMQYLQNIENAYGIYKEDMIEKGDVYKRYLDKADLELQMIQLEKEQYQKNIEKYIETLFSSIDIEALKLHLIDSKVENNKQNISRNKLLLKKGKIKKIELTKLYTEKYKIEYQRLNEVYNLNLLYYEMYYNIDKNSIINTDSKSIS